MQKRKVLFVISRLSIGGAQKSLIKALSTIDYEKNDVDLYVRENKIELAKKIPKEVNMIINSNTKNYEYELPALFGECVKRIGTFLRCNKIVEFGRKKNSEYVVKRKYKYESEKYFFDDRKYDVAISYMNGYTCRFVMDYVQADYKVCFYLGSTDNMPTLHKQYLPRYNKIVVDSEGVSEFLQSEIPAIKNKLLLIPNYLDEQEIRKNAKESENIVKNVGKIAICSCGRLSSEKGFDMSIKAADILKKKNIIFDWCFVGDGLERKNLEEMVKEKMLEKEIVFVGMKDNPYPYIDICDIYVQPSYEESFGLTIAEAKVLCKPIVSTRTVGALEQIEHMRNGVLTGISAEEIADGIMKYLEDKELKKRVISNLEKIDYTDKFREYQKQWETLLEG